MTVAALTLFVLALLLVGGVRAAVQRRRTGDSGVRLPSGARDWGARLTGAAGGFLTGAAAPVADLLGLPLLPWLDEPAARLTGLALAAAGIAAVFAAQLAMGASWRTTVDPTEHPPLVTTGPFRLVRNPIYAALTVVIASLALAVPNAIAVLGLAVMALGIEIQVRRIEEPYLRSVHGSDYQRYAARTGRFLPGLGRLR